MPRSWSAVILVLVLGFGACSQTSEGDSAPADGAQSGRIVSISPTATESLFAIGAGPQVVAVDDLSTYPANAPVTDLSAFQPNVEAIAEFEPTLVVLSFDPGDVVAGLEALDIQVLLQPTATSLEDAYRQIEDLGAATGHVETAAELVSGIEEDIDEVVSLTPVPSPAATYYHEIDPSLYSLTSSTFIGELYGLFGLENIADPADAEGYGYPQLSAEWILEQDPDLIYLADTRCCGQDATTVAGRPGWAGLGAVEAARIVELDDDIASRWGPRIVDYVETIAASVADLEPASS